MTQLLSYHIIPWKAYYVDSLAAGMLLTPVRQLPDVGNLTVRLHVKNITFVTPEGATATVILSNIHVGPGVVHIINHVLIPPASSPGPERFLQNAADSDAMRPDA